jgi:hypothetical protein
MRNGTADRTTENNPEQAPVDVALTRESAALLIADNAELPNSEELETLTLRLRGMIMVTIPDVEAYALKRPDGDVQRACALACIGEAQMRLRLEPNNATFPAHVAHAQRLTRSALADHYANLSGGES